MERRFVSRIPVTGAQIQLLEAENNEGFPSPTRKVRDISFKGISFDEVTDDFVSAGNDYSFILNLTGKSIMGRGKVVHKKDGAYGMAFSQIDNKQIALLCEVLDPIYAGETLEKRDHVKKNEETLISYESIKSGARVEYFQKGEETRMSLMFLDKYVEWTSSTGISVSIVEDFKGSMVKVSTKNSIYRDVISQAIKLLEYARVEIFLKNKFLDILKSEHN
jgi:hypothetical protein